MYLASRERGQEGFDPTNKVANFGPGMSSGDLGSFSISQTNYDLLIIVIIVVVAIWIVLAFLIIKRRK